MRKWKSRLKKATVLTLTAALIGGTVKWTPLSVAAAGENPAGTTEEGLSSETVTVSGDESAATPVNMADGAQQTVSGNEVVIACETVDLGEVETSAYSWGFFSMGVDTTRPQLAEGNHAKWIDRLDIPQYAIDFYNKLAEGADGDGVDDILIDDSSFSAENAKTVNYGSGTDVFNAIEVTAITGASQMDDDEINAVYKNIRAAYDAFDRDYPGVFWMSGSSQSKCLISHDGTNYTYKFYFPLKTHQDATGDELFDVRKSGYQTEAAIRTAMTARDANAQTIRAGAAGQGVVGKLKYFNKWLTEHNEYNTDLSNAPSNSPDSWDCITALAGKTGTEGPVCESYARAFKLLCDNEGIPCVLVDGQAKNSISSTGEAHMWNYVQVGSSWYAVDVTWNDPVVNGISGALSGYESEKWLLVGSDTVINSLNFITSHPVSNQASMSGIAFTNGPVLSAEKYTSSGIESVTITGESTLTYGYTSAPSVTVVTEAGTTDGVTYQWYQEQGETDSELSGATTAAFPTGQKPGTYYCKVTYGTNQEDSGVVTVEQATVIPAVNGTTSKTYDGSTTINNSAALSITLTGVVGTENVAAAAANYAYADANAGTNKEVKATGITLSGTDASNYKLSSDTAAANVGSIVQKDITGATVVLENGGSLFFTNQNQTQKVTSVTTADGMAVPAEAYQVSGNTAKSVDNYTLTIAAKSEGNFKGSVTADFTIKYLPGSGVVLKYNGSTAAAEWYNEAVTVTAEGYTLASGLDKAFSESITISDEGSSQPTFYFMNSSGQITDGMTTAVVKIDKTAPSFAGEGMGIKIETDLWNSLLNTITFGKFFTETKTVTIQAKEDGSGIENYYYYVDKSGSENVLTESELKGKTFTPGNTFSMDADSKYVIYAYAKDNAGNQSGYICTNGLVLDTVIPVLSDVAEPAEANGTLLDTSAEVSFTGSETGTYYYAVRTASEAAPTVDELIAGGSGISSKALVKGSGNSVSMTGLNANTSYVLYMAAKDAAGNKTSSVTQVAFTTRKTMPVFDSVPAINGTYGQQVKDMTLNGPASTNGVAGSWKISETATDIAKVGTSNKYDVIFTPADTTSYSSVTVQVTPVVSKKKVTVTVVSAEREYGKANPTLQVTYASGTLVSGDTESDLGITLSTTAQTNSDVGVYAISASYDSANYEVTFVAGNLTITQAQGSIQIAAGSETISKTFGSGEFALSGITRIGDGTLTYTVGSSKNAAGAAVADTEVIVVNNGTVTIKGAGSAEITLAMAATKNYKAAESKKITVGVSKKAAATIASESKVYVCTVGSGSEAVTIDVAGKLPADRGTTSYSVAKEGSILSDVAVSTSGVLTYKAGTGTAGETAKLTVTAVTNNYADMTFTVDIRLTDKFIVKEKTDAPVQITGSNVLTYGSALSGLTLNTNVAVFVCDMTGSEQVVRGTLSWQTPDAVPAVGTTTAAWIFTPNDTEIYEALTGTEAIVVNKAEPEVETPVISGGVVYHPERRLADLELNGSQGSWTVGGVDVTVPGSWAWQDASQVPEVATGEYAAVFTPTDTDNYKPAVKYVAVNVEKATPYIQTKPTAGAVTYQESLEQSVLTGGKVVYGSDTSVESNNVEVAGSFSWQNPETKPTVSDGDATEYTVVFQPTDSADYNTVTCKVTLSVNPAQIPSNAPGNTINAPYSADKVSKVNLPENWVWDADDKDTPLSVGVGTAAVAVYQGADANNYLTTEVRITITRSECEHRSTEVRNAVEATCTENGYTGDTYCTDCGEKLTDGNAIAALGHDYVSEVTTRPTVETEGIRTYTCTRSGCGHTYTEAIPRLVEPFIDGNSGVSGWEAIRQQAVQSQEGSSIAVDMYGFTVVPGNVLESLRGRNITLSFEMGNQMTWSVNGMTVTGETIGDINFEVTPDTNTIPTDLVSGITQGSLGYRTLSLTHNGAFGLQAVLRLNVGSVYAGKCANIFYYNPTERRMEYVCEDIVDAGGYADLTFNHASEYVVVIAEASMRPQETGSDNDDNENVGGNDNNTQSTVTNANVKSPKTGQSESSAVWLLLIGIAAGSAVLGGIFLYFGASGRRRRG